MNEFGEKKTTFAYQKNFLFFASKTFTFATQARGSKQYELTVLDIKKPLTETQATNYLIQQQQWQEKLLKIMVI